MKREENARRGQDEARSNQAHKMFERSFYDVKTSGYKGIEDKETQVKGVDAIFTYDGEEYLCDEKAAVNYAGKNLQTFSLELGFIDRGNNWKSGWFVNDGNLTNSYLFAWFDNDTFEIALVRKQDIEKYLDNIGWHKGNLVRKEQLMREGKNTATGNIWTNGCKFSFSERLPEKPINILVPRSELVRISVFTGRFQYDEMDKEILGINI